MRTILVVSCFLAAGISLVLTAVMRRLAPRLGLVDKPGGRKAHRQPTPFGGGVAIVAATCLVVGGAALTAAVLRRHPSLLPLSESMIQDVGLAVERLRMLLYVLGGGLLLALFGLWDDIRPKSPAAKFVVQLLVGIVLVATTPEVRISIVPPISWLRGPITLAWLQGAATVVWIVVLSNAFNLLDNMDGLCGTVAFICGGALLILALQSGQFFIAGFVLALMGAVLGFLCFNFPPAGIFMGDMGSMFIGYMLATATVLASFADGGQANPLFPVVVPLIIFAVPLYDSVSVVAIRFHHGRPIMKGDQNHFSHRIRRLGMSVRRVLLTVALLTLATSLGATVPYGSAVWRAVVPAIAALCVVAVIMQLELVSVEVECPEPEQAQEDSADGAD